MKKTFTFNIKRMGIVLLCLLIAYVVLLSLVYLIPADAVYENAEDVRWYADLHGGQNWLPAPLNDENAVMDLFTDWAMMQRVQEGEGLNPLQAAMVPEYARYWHGYLVFLRPLMVFFTYTEVRQILPVIFWCLLAWLCALLGKKLNGGVAFTLIATLCMTNIAIIPSVFQYSHIFFITFIMCIVLLYRSDTPNFERDIFLLFFICGSVTNFIDFLTTPLISLGLPLTIYLMLRLKNKQTGFFANCLRIVTTSIAWGCGYALTWISKWLIGSAVLRTNVLGDAMESAIERTNGQADATFTHAEVILKNVRIFTQFKIPEILLLATTFMLGVWLIYICVKRRSIHPLWQHAPFAALALYPYVWYFVLANHSYHHAFFTFRTQIILPFAVCGCMWVAAAEYYKEYKPFTAVKNTLKAKLPAKKATATAASNSADK